MNYLSWRRQLELADRNVALGTQHLAKQRALIDELTKKGSDISLAVSILTAMEDSQRLHMAQRDRLRSAGPPADALPFAVRVQGHAADERLLSCAIPACPELGPINLFQLLAAQGINLEGGDVLQIEAGKYLQITLNRTLSFRFTYKEMEMAATRCVQ